LHLAAEEVKQSNIPMWAPPLLKRVLLAAVLLVCWCERCLADPGALDTSFNAGSVAGTNCCVSDVKSLAIQPDGKLLVAGVFQTNFGGGGLANNYARLNTNGSLDTNFLHATGADRTVNAIAVRSDGKILLGGSFVQVNNTPRWGIARLNDDGTVDTNFGPYLVSGPYEGVAKVLAPQVDGKVIVAGSFDHINSLSRAGFGRINADGGPDASFNPGYGAQANTIYCLAIQPDGKVLVGGGFTNFNLTLRYRIARLNSDGSVDQSFNPGNGATYVEDTVRAVLVQPDGKIIVAGEFGLFGGDTWPRSLCRLNADGTRDLTFNTPGGVSGSVNALARQPNGKIVLGGRFSTVGGVTRGNLAVLNPDGSLDTSFDPGTGANGVLNATVSQPDGKVVFGGPFDHVNNVARFHVARVHGDPFLSASLSSSQLNQVVIAWPSSFSNYFLEYRSELSPATTWQSITDNVSIVGEYKTHTNQNGDLSGLFRLRR
jgi:uncharacterized delta-60 repeat protein